MLLGNLNLERSYPSISDTTQILDFIARSNLKRINLNYGHGTGHGVGHFLNVHEGPISISPMSEKPLIPNIILSNEPGCYLENEFGVRIENLLIAKENKEKREFSFENITCFPYERNLIATNLTSLDDIDYINSYHQQVYNRLKDLLTASEIEFLSTKTALL